MKNFFISGLILLVLGITLCSGRDIFTSDNPLLFWPERKTGDMVDRQDGFALFF